MKNDIEMIKEVVEEIGLRPRFDEDGDLVVRYQLKTIFFFAAEESSFVSMAMPRIYKVKEGEEALAESFNYQEMKDWFLEKYPEIANFHEKRAELMEKTQKAKEAKRAESAKAKKDARRIALLTKKAA